MTVKCADSRYRPELTIKKEFQKINVKATWFDGTIILNLMRNGKKIASRDLFGSYDSSMNQTDAVLTNTLARPGDAI